MDKKVINKNKTWTSRINGRILPEQLRFVKRLARINKASENRMLRNLIAFCMKKENISKITADIK